MAALQQLKQLHQIPKGFCRSSASSGSGCGRGCCVPSLFSFHQDRARSREIVSFLDSPSISSPLLSSPLRTLTKTLRLCHRVNVPRLDYFFVFGGRSVGRWGLFSSVTKANTFVSVSLLTIMALHCTALHTTRRKSL